MFDHHPALAETGELEIVQRHALHEAGLAAAATGNTDWHGSEECARAAIEAYLQAMRAAYKPEAIVISEGDHVVVKVGDLFVKVGVESDNSGTLRLTLDDGDEVHYPRPWQSAPPA